MGTELMNMAGFKKGPAAAFRGHETDESLSDGIGTGYPLIRYGGKEWVLQLHDDQFPFKTSDDYGSPYIDVIILRQARNKSKAYFPNWEEGTKEAPVCSSLDGIVPDPGVEDKQAETCAVCPRNVFKKNEKGMMVKECSDAKRLAVLPIIPAHMAKATGGPVLEPTFLRVPAASLQNLARMGEMARKQGYEYYTFLCRIDFDPEKHYPKMRFKAIQELTEAEAIKVLELREDTQSYRICNGDRGRDGMKEIKREEKVKLAPAGDTGLIQQDPDKAELAARLEADRMARMAAVREEDTKAKEATAKPMMIELKAEPTQSVDTEEPEQSDTALDALIDSLLPKN